MEPRFDARATERPARRSKRECITLVRSFLYSFADFFDSESDGIAVSTMF
jgi:hypothetical protein